MRNRVGGAPAFRCAVAVLCGLALELEAAWQADSTNVHVRFLPGTLGLGRVQSRLPDKTVVLQCDIFGAKSLALGAVRQGPMQLSAILMCSTGRGSKVL